MHGKIISTRHRLHHSNLKHRTHSRKKHRPLRCLQYHQLQHPHRKMEQPLQLQRQPQQRSPHQSKPLHEQRVKGSPIPSLPVLEILLCLLYLGIVLDVIYVLGHQYFKASNESPKPKHVAMLAKRRHVTSDVSNARGDKTKGFLTLDNLWRRLNTEASHMRKVDSQHRAITQIMMETRLKARSPEREKPANRLKANKEAERDLQIDMVRWADKISADHDHRGK